MEAGILCSRCNTWNRPGAVFCAACGTRLAAQTPPAAVEATRQPYPEPDRRPIRPPIQRSPTSRSTGWLGKSANVLAWFAALAAAVLICLALPLLSTGALTNDGLYKESLRSQNVYERFPDLFAEQMMLTQARLGQQANVDFSGVGPGDWKLVAQELFPPEWLQTQAERLVDEILAAARPGAAAPTLNIPLADITRRLGGEAGMRIYKQVIQTKRECSFDDFFTIIDWIDNDPAARLPICNIPSDLSEFAALIGGYNNGNEMIADLLTQLPGQLPQEVSLAQVVRLPIGRVGAWLQLGRLAGWLCLALAGLALLLTFAAPTGRTLSGAMLLWGVPLALAGVVVLLEAVALPWLVGGLIVGGFQGVLAPGLQRILLHVVDAVIKSSARMLIWSGSALLLVGVLLAGMALLSVFFRSSAARARRW